ASEIVALQAPESTGVVRDEVADAYILAGCVRPLGNVHGRAVIDVEVALCSSDPDQRTGNRLGNREYTVNIRVALESVPVPFANQHAVVDHHHARRLPLLG